MTYNFVCGTILINYNGLAVPPHFAGYRTLNETVVFKLNKPMQTNMTEMQMIMWNVKNEFEILTPIGKTWNDVKNAIIEYIVYMDENDVFEYDLDENGKRVYGVDELDVIDTLSDIGGFGLKYIEFDGLTVEQYTAQYDVSTEWETGTQNMINIWATLCRIVKRELVLAVLKNA